MVAVRSESRLETVHQLQGCACVVRVCVCETDRGRERVSVCVGGGGGGGECIICTQLQIVLMSKFALLV